MNRDSYFKPQKFAHRLTKYTSNAYSEYILEQIMEDQESASQKEDSVKRIGLKK